jgi:DNA modification methylase
MTYGATRNNAFSEMSKKPGKSPRRGRSGNGRIRRLPKLPSHSMITIGARNNCEWALITGDASRSLRYLPGECVDCAITSPPYYWQRDYRVKGQLGHEKRIEDYVASLTAVFHEVKRVLKRRGLLFLVMGDTYYSGKGQPQGGDPKHRSRVVSRTKYRAVDRPGFGLPKKTLIGVPWRLALALISEGWVLRSAVTWKKPKSLAEPNAHDRPWRSAEHVFIFAKTGKHYFRRHGLSGEEDVWEIEAPSQNGWKHAAPFPEALVARCLACGCPPRGTVLDPFAGSGTTVKVAVSTGRPAVGIDLKPSYIRMAKRRVNYVRSSRCRMRRRQRGWPRA